MELILLLTFSLGRISADETYLLSNKEYRLGFIHFNKLLARGLSRITYPNNYRFVERPMSWFEANETCRNMGTGLVQINSEEENDLIVDEINRLGYKKKALLDGVD